jgi:hypothetical protein
MIIRRKVKLRPHQGWSSQILPYLNEKPYGDYRIAEYEAGVWESEELMEAFVGKMYDGETARYVYEHAVMTEEEYEEWTTASG